MNRQSQLLFEAPFTSEATLYTNPFSNPEGETEWELPEINPYMLGEEEWEQESGYPSRRQTIRETVSGFSRYSNAVPPKERVKIARIAQMIIQSHRSGQPIRTVRLVGHADRDVQRGASFERKISGDRALEVKKQLINSIGSPTISSRISWRIQSLGANQIVIKNPKNEYEIRYNRRVDILLPIPCGSLGVTGRFMSTGILNSAMQRCAGNPPKPIQTKPIHIKHSCIKNFVNIPFFVRRNQSKIVVRLTAIWIASNTSGCEGGSNYFVSVLGNPPQSSNFPAGFQGGGECSNNSVGPQSSSATFDVKPGSNTLRISTNLGQANPQSPCLRIVGSIQVS